MSANHFKNKTFAIVDVETSGTSAVHGSVIEVGILRIENGVCVERFQSLVNPGHSLSPWITSITGIQPEWLEDAPAFEDIAEKVHELLDGAVFVAHNARFDYAFIKNEFKRLGQKFSAQCLCSVRLSRALDAHERKHDLSSVIDRYGFQCAARHRALDDADVVWQLMQIFQRRDSNALDEAITRLLKTHTLPPFMDERTVASLPEGPGVYIFYDSENSPLYVGKSRNLRTRVLSHFSSDHQESRELTITQHVARIETRTTPGELSALILEATLVKTMIPAYNRLLRKRKALVVARRSSKERYTTVTLEHTGGIDPERHHEVMGIFKTMSQAKQFLSQAATEHQLCEKLLGTENARTECFGFQLGKCKGACRGEENPDEYNARLETAFADRRIKAWPYKGALVIEEHAEESSQTFILDNWCLIASVSEGTDETVPIEPAFDYDNYKIFRRYLRNPANRHSIRVVPREEFAAVSLQEEMIIS